MDATYPYGGNAPQTWGDTISSWRWKKPESALGGTMRIDVLQEVVDLSESLNFTKTAGKFFITQPALSRHVAGLEEEIGLRIFDREQHGVSLTDAGAEFTRAARKMLKEYDELVGLTERLRDGFKGTLKIGYLVAATRPFLSSASVMFENAFPDVQVLYLAMDPQGIREALANGSIDLGITSDAYMHVPGEYHCVRIYEDRYCIAVSPQHELAGRESVTLNDLSGQTFSYPGRDFSGPDSENTDRVLSAIPHKLDGRINRGANDTSLIVANGTSIVPILGHMRFYNDPNFRIIPFSENPYEPVHIIALTREGSNNSYADKYVECILTTMKLLGEFRAE